MHYNNISELLPFWLCSGIVRFPTSTIHSYHTLRVSTHRQNVALSVSPLQTRTGVCNINVKNYILLLVIHFHYIMCAIDVTLIGMNTGNQEIIPGLWLDGTILIVSSAYRVLSKYPPNPCIMLSWVTFQVIVAHLLLSVNGRPL